MEIIPWYWHKEVSIPFSKAKEYEKKESINKFMSLIALLPPEIIKQIDIIRQTLIAKNHANIVNQDITNQNNLVNYFNTPEYISKAIDANNINVKNIIEHNNYASYINSLSNEKILSIYGKEFGVVLPINPTPITPTPTPDIGITDYFKSFFYEDIDKKIGERFMQGIGEGFNKHILIPFWTEVKGTIANFVDILDAASIPVFTTIIFIGICLAMLDPQNQKIANRWIYGSLAWFFIFKLIHLLLTGFGM